MSPSRYAFIKALATKPTPTLLYEAPSHFWFYFGCWSSAIFMLGWTAVTAAPVLHMPDGTAAWVSYPLIFAYVLFIAMAGYLISRTPNIVGSIRLVPRPGPARTGTSYPPPQMEISVKRMVPFMRPKVLRADLEKVALQSRFSLPNEYVPELRRVERRREAEAAERALRRADMDRLLTMPFRRMGRSLAQIFGGMKSALTGSGFGEIKVDGKIYKVDVTRGYAHDRFKTLERVLLQ